ncbi:MAG: thiol peroxidase [Candidatus Sericytochromatia bacterium]
MSDITFKGNPVHTAGSLPEPGSEAPDFKAVATDLSEASLADFRGKPVLLNIFPSVDTGVCAMSVRRFYKETHDRGDLTVLNVSLDLPFALKRFCAAEGLDNVKALSDFRYGQVAANYGVRMTDGPLAGLLSRAVVVVGADGKVRYREQVPEIGQEPDYDAALKSLEG